MCIVTRSHKRTLAALARLGIGPWRIYSCNPQNTTHQTYRGQSSSYTLTFCYAELPGGMVYEVIEPVSGPNIFNDWLDQGKGEGVHHIAYDCNHVPWEERIQGFAERGMGVVQEGKWRGDNRFAFFEDAETGTCFETIAFEEGFSYPEPDEWFIGA
ncbi:MAG: hypothetical protein Q9163_001486 [Psora crenata]